MLSPDVKPSRLERSKLLIQSLLDKLSGERVGLIVFSGTAFLQAPMSADYEIIREFLPSLGPDFLPEGGTNYSQLIDTSLDAFGEGSAADRYLIILSDGGATDDAWKGKVDALAKRGIRVIGLGVGTAAGSMIPDGAGAFMKDDSGAVVMSKLESGTLRDLASATHGVYLDASAWVDLPKVLAATVEQGRKGRFVERNTVRYAERFQWALAPALLCLLASFWLEMPVLPKAREVRLSGDAAAATRAKATAAAVAAAALLLLGAPPPAAGQDAPDPAATLSKVVGRLSSQQQCSALDWAELGGDTVTWGQHIQSGAQQVPERPVRDALAAVDMGSRSDPKAADWAKLRSDLEALLRKQDDQKKQDQKKDRQKDQQENQQENQQQSQGQDQKQNQNQQQSQQQQSGSDSSGQNKPQESGGEPKNQQQARQQKAFGDMGAPTPEPRQGEEPQNAMQKVGGVKKDQPNDPARNDPSLAIPLEKLEQVKNQDSPAELFEMLRRSEPMPTPANKGPNW
jgi:Ca-activated chloride channel family protein